MVSQVETQSEFLLAKEKMLVTLVIVSVTILSPGAQNWIPATI